MDTRLVIGMTVFFTHQPLKAEYTDPKTRPYFNEGVITGVDTTGEYWFVQPSPDDEYALKKHGNQLLSQEQVDQIDARLNQLQSQLDQEFEAYRQQIAEKLTQASTLVQQSVAMAKQGGRKVTDEFYRELRDMVHALKADGGWRSSTIDCM